MSATTPARAQSTASLTALSDADTPKPEQRAAFKRLRAEIDRALEAGDWDRFLAKCEEALASLPEHASSDGERHEVVGLVGEYEIGERGPAQLEHSVEILEAYQEQLRGAYAEQATKRAGWQDSQRYLVDLRMRLRPESGSSAATPPPPPPAPTTDSSRPPDRAARRPDPLTLSGAVVTGVGGALLIAGLAYYGSAWSRYEALRDRHERDGSVTDDEESHAFRRFRLSLALVVPAAALLGAGVGLLVAGLRRSRGTQGRLAITPTGLRARF